MDSLQPFNPLPSQFCALLQFCNYFWQFFDLLWFFLVTFLSLFVGFLWLFVKTFFQFLSFFFFYIRAFFQVFLDLCNNCWRFCLNVVTFSHILEQERERNGHRKVTKSKKEKKWPKKSRTNASEKCCCVVLVFFRFGQVGVKGLNCTMKNIWKCYSI